MKIQHSSWNSIRAFGAVLCLAALVTSPAVAQGIQTIDPNDAIDADLVGPVDQPAPAQQPYREPVYETPAYDASAYEGGATYEQPAAQPNIAYNDGASTAYPAGAQPAVATETPAADSTTYAEDDLIGAAEGVFGKGAEGLARMIEDILEDQGEPNGYIVGREAAGAFVVGTRYGSGTLYHKVEGQRPVYWTGPSIGFDVGANAANTFVLVYNLYDTEELYERYPSGEGDAYFIGGMTASYLRKGDVVLIPIRLGAGLRLGINAGYMKFSKRQRWLPF